MPEVIDVAVPARLSAHRGVAAPQPRVPVPAGPERLGQVKLAPGPRCWCVGVHGGAGETTLARLLGTQDVPALGTSHRWPEHEDGTIAPVLLVARYNATGLRAAQTAAATWAADAVPPVELMGLVLMADAPGRTPKPLRDYGRIIRGGLPRTWELPWVDAWRTDDNPLASPRPHPVTRVLHELATLLTPPQGHGPSRAPDLD